MKIHKGYAEVNLVDPVVTMGVFDGVHTGHRALLDRLVNVAETEGRESAVITFYPHPRMVLDNENQTLSFLTTMDEKQELLSKSKVDHLIILEFSREFSNIKACDFIRDILVREMGTKHLIVGYDHHFGRRGEGDFSTIRQCPDLKNVTVEQFHGVYSGSVPVSSSIIRDYLLNGNLDEANMMLGYSYFLRGGVVHGKHLGKKLGYPTANILPDDRYKLVPANGVYAVEVQLGDENFRGMLSIGTNPTVNSAGSARSIEVNIFDFDRDIYGSSILIRFRKRLRDEKKFDNIEQLVRQMKSDKSDSLRFLA